MNYSAPPVTNAQIGARLRALRQGRRWSQAEVAQRLGLTQSQLSKVERGAAELNARAFVNALALFNVGVERFGGGAAREDDGLRHALVAHGARHLLGDERLVEQRWSSPTVVAAEVLRRGGPSRELAALAPVIAIAQPEVSLPGVHRALWQEGREGRVGWLVETLLQVLRAWRWGEPSEELGRRRQRALLALELYAETAPHSPSACAMTDPLSGVTTLESVRELLAEGDAIARKWRIATPLTTGDFEDALRQAYESC